MKTVILGMVVVVLLVSVGAQTQRPADIATVVGSGTIDGTRYSNSYFKLTVNTPKATLQLSPMVNTEKKLARMVQVLSKDATREDTFTFAVSVEALSNLLDKYPGTPASVYVRSVRHQLEREGLVTLREESTVIVDGVEFVGAVLQVPEENGRKHCRGIYTTFRQGYILAFDVEASSEAKLNELLAQSVRFGK